MCGRFTLTVSEQELLERYGIQGELSLSHQPRYNVAPMQMVPAVVHDGTTPRMGLLRWGLVPSWAKDERMASRMINARAETLMERVSFRRLIYRRRCLIPADSFYEWKTVEGRKQPMRVMMRDGRIFSLAGLYDIWVHPASGQRIGTFTIITTQPNQLMADIHHRMPVILDREQEQIWLDREQRDPQTLLALLRPYPPEEMKAYPVSPVVGHVRNDGPECIEEWQGP